jgi:hypothetical protein
MESLYDKMRRVQDVRVNDTAQRQNRLAEKSKVALGKIIDKKFQTTFIGAISAFEEIFGFMWGHGKNTSDLTDEERMWKDKWDKVRTTILNNGNNQARAVQNELRQYLVKWQGYQLNLPVRGQE